MPLPSPRVIACCFHYSLYCPPHSLVLFLVYFPMHLKYAEVHTDPNPARGNKSFIFRDTTAEWRLAITLATIVAAHMYV
jgi:hypothetical protein